MTTPTSPVTDGTCARPFLGWDQVMLNHHHPSPRKLHIRTHNVKPPSTAATTEHGTYGLTGSHNPKSIQILTSTGQYPTASHLPTCLAQFPTSPRLAVPGDVHLGVSHLRLIPTRTTMTVIVIVGYCHCHSCSYCYCNGHCFRWLLLIATLVLLILLLLSLYFTRSAKNGVNTTTNR